MKFGLFENSPHPTATPLFVSMMMMIPIACVDL